MRSRRAFTLIELLVVVTIIVVLLALLTPALDKAVEAAERAECAARLHAWGLAIPQYSLDHRNRLLSTLRNQGNNDEYPCLAWGDNSTSPGFDTTFARKKYDDWSAETMQPYIQGGDFKQHLYGKLWYCPSNRAALKEQTNQSQAVSPAAGWIASDYAYFARVDLWTDHATRPEELTEKRLGGGRLLMADTLYFFNPGGIATSWWNHGDDGYSVHDASWGEPVRHGPPQISGTNQLVNDGAVAWKDRSKFDFQKMAQRAADDRWVSSEPGPSATGNINFW